MQWTCKSCGATGEVEEITTSVSCTECDAYVVWDESDVCPYWYTTALDELESIHNSSGGLKIISSVLAAFATVMAVVNFRFYDGELFFFNWGVCGLAGLLALLIEMGRKEWCQNAIMGLSVVGALLSLYGYFKEMSTLASLFGVALFCGALIFARRKELFKEDAPTFAQFTYLLENRKARKAVTLESYNALNDEKKKFLTAPMLLVYVFAVVAVATAVYKGIYYPAPEVSLGDQAAAVAPPAGDDPQAVFEYCLSGAQQGDVEMMCQVGVLYVTGEGTEKNFDEGVSWFRRAADAGFVQAYMFLAQCYSGAVDPAKADPQEFFNWSKKAADAGITEGKANMAVCYFRGLGCEKDCAAGARYAEEAVAQMPVLNIWLARYYLGQFGDFKVVDPVKAFHFSTAASQFESTADAGKFCLAICYASGYGCTQNAETAIRLAMEAAIAGDQDAVSTVRLVFQRPPALYE
ncbi:MAG: sel1 repeat family protein [Lentisphaerae bacterium]|nr:sel1 repeat family protein [Lentisphaerota bacterium]